MLQTPIKTTTKQQTLQLRLPETWQELRAFEPLLKLGIFGDQLRSEQMKMDYRLYQSYGKGEEFIETVKNQLTRKDFVILQNTFEYNVLLSQVRANGFKVDHLVFWTRDRNFTPHSKFPLGKEYRDFFTWENPAALKSVPDIIHWQVFAIKN